MFNAIFFQVSKCHVDIPVVNPSIFHFTNDETDDFWRILQLQEKSSAAETFVVFSSGILHLVRPLVPEVVASCSGLRGLHDVAVAGDEIFVLEGPVMFKSYFNRVITDIDFNTLTFVKCSAML